MVCILLTQMMPEDAYSLAQRLCLHSSKSCQKSSVISGGNGFLLFQARLSYANIRGSEDGAANIRPVPVFRPVSCFSPKC